MIIKYRQYYSWYYYRYFFPLISVHYNDTITTNVVVEAYNVLIIGGTRFSGAALMERII
jgi:hypothetical protein